MTFPLITKRLSIRPLAPEHLETFVEYRQHPEVAKFQSWDQDFSREQGRELIESQAGVVFPDTGEWLQLAIELQEDQSLVGDLALHRLSASVSFEIGFTIAVTHQGRGYAFEAARALLNKLFEERGAVSVVAYTDSRNTPSKALLRKLGFIADPTMSWIEEFKGETVTVETFELAVPSGR